MATGESLRLFQKVPFSSLVTREFDNLYVIGRCMAASGDAWEIMRVIPSVVLYRGDSRDSSQLKFQH